MNAVRGVCKGSLATRQRAKKEVEKMKKITRTINTATVELASAEVKDGKVVPKIGSIELYSFAPLSDANIAKAVARLDPKATIVSVNQSMNKYAVNIEEFVKLAHVEK